MFSQHEKAYFRNSRASSGVEMMFFSEKVCTYDGLSKYGISTDSKGINRLKGPGVFEEPGAAHMGGRLPFQLSEMCESYRESDESQIYQAWLKGGNEGIQDFICLNSDFKGEDGDLDLNICGPPPTLSKEEL